MLRSEHHDALAHYNDEIFWIAQISRNTLNAKDTEVGGKKDMINDGTFSIRTHCL